MWPWSLPFSMVKTTGAEVVWSNRRLPFDGGDHALVEEFAWNIPIDAAKETNAESGKTFYAECYGGVGIHHNGGGVRCAWSGNWLVKGIGINLLSGYSNEDAAKHRKNGRASLCEIFVEAIWGEVLHEALPYGAARMTAVIKTGETLKDALHPTGGLGIREFVWRPAQFMRAHAFQVRPENRAQIPSDTARIKEAIAHLPDMLPMPAALSKQEIAMQEPLARLKIGLGEMVRRFAEQMAAAKAKRLSHGTLTTSNVGLDGRWNDLNSVSALPSYGYRRNMTPFWDDQFTLIETINLLCFYIGKYFPAVSGNKPEEMPTAEWLTVLYKRHYTDALARRFVALCGYPHIVANRIWTTREGHTAMRTLSSSMITLARSGHSPRRPYDDAMHENTVFGEYHLPKILLRAACATSAGVVESALCDLIADQKTRRDFVHQYGIVKKLMFKEAQSQGVSAPSFARLVRINCQKAGRNIPFLFRNVIFDECRRLAEGHQDPAELRREADRVIQPVINEARMVYQEPRNFNTLLWSMERMTLEYDARSNCLIANIEDEKTELPYRATTATLQPNTEIAHLVSSMRNAWGSAYEEMMQ
jgi:CDGSH-type Zn-finger protein